MSALQRLQEVRRALGEGPYEKRGTWRGRPYRFSNRGPAAHMGRFGGGWERNVGIQMGRGGFRGTVIVNLGKSSLRIDRRKS